jgi:SAM-dependent methyltransferase
VYTVHADDEMHRFIREFWSWPHHVLSMRAPSDVMRTYLRGGEIALEELERALRDQGRAFSDVRSFLEFACGYGRVTRFLVTKLPRGTVEVSDIDRSAVNFTRSTFGVQGFYSTERAEELEHGTRYDVVFVASLFSHLTIDQWNAWLARLCEATLPGGLLVFSTHGPYARDVVYGDYWRSQLEPMADGFSYLRTNETHGRLAEEYYGSAFVTEKYVRSLVAERRLGTIKRVYPALLWNTQDLYVLETPSSDG